MSSTLEKLTSRNAPWLSVSRVRCTAKNFAVLRRIHLTPVIIKLFQSRRLWQLALTVSQRLGQQATTCYNQISIDTQLQSKILAAVLQAPFVPNNKENWGWRQIKQVKADILPRQIRDHHSAHSEFSLLTVTPIQVHAVSQAWQPSDRGKNRLKSCWKPWN